MANYGYMSPSPNGLNGHNSTTNGYHVQHLDLEIVQEKPKSCCGLSSQFIVYVLFIFNFIFLTSGTVMLIFTIIYRSGLVEKFGENMELSTIRSVLPFNHPINLVHYSMVLCGLLICIISVIMMVASCAKTQAAVDSTADKSKRSRVSQEDDFVDMEVTLRDEEDDDDDLDEVIGLSDLSTVSDIQRHRTGRKRSKDVDLNGQEDHSRSMSTCFLCFFIFTLLFLFTIQLSIALVGFVSVSMIIDRQQLEATNDQKPFPPSSILLAIRNNLDSSFTNAQILNISSRQFDILQERFKCCGLAEFNDYPRDQSIPESCCKSKNTPDCGHRRHPSNIYYDGCASKLENALREQLTFLASLAFGLSIVEVFGLLFSCCLYVQMLAATKDQIRDV